MERKIGTPLAMAALGEELAGKFDVLLLHGPLGAGKTTLVQGFVRGLGVDAAVQSPSYGYLREYAGKILHVDCYNIDSASQFVGLGIPELVGEFEKIVVEWPKFLEEWVGEIRGRGAVVEIELDGESGRLVKISEL